MKYEQINQRAALSLRNWWFGDDDIVRGLEYGDGLPVRTSPIVAIDVDMHLVQDSESVVYLLSGLPDGLPGSDAAQIAQLFHAGLLEDLETDDLAKRNALIARNEKLAHNERALVRFLVKVSVGLMAVVLAGAWVWMRLTGRVW